MSSPIQLVISCGPLSMKHYSLLTFFLTCTMMCFNTQSKEPDFDLLRSQYSQSPDKWPSPNIEEGIEYKELGLLPHELNPPKQRFSGAQYELGKKLFHDGALSVSGQIACASCHDPDLGWGDGRRVSFGHNRKAGKRNAPSIENVASLGSFFWDGRALTLQQQALMPIQDPSEMNFSLPELVERLSSTAHYPEMFEAAFDNASITPERIGEALAAFEKEIVSRRSNFDYFLLSRFQKQLSKRERYNAKMSDKALWGLHLFRTKARCANCHYGPWMTDGEFHNIGLTYYGREYEDLGRYEVTGNPSDVGKFKTPGLRGVMNTKPWMHNGLFDEMEGILNIYNVGGVPQRPIEGDPLSPVTSSLLRPLELTSEEIGALAAFLESVTAPPARVFE